ncbi:MAG: hypothetical protein CMH63_03005 [Nanoarchaeota archaeon]|nr:hypothetical protein [Nanoarchaeota archaeon]|tara:strand:- start:2474 stop:3658 length:1185 start_codon:yes stop_codon:yes gene_type:complete
MEIRLKDLKQIGKEVYVDLEYDTKLYLRGCIKKKFSSLSNFSRKLGLPVDKFSRNNDLIHFFEGHKISLDFLHKIISPFRKDFNDDFIESKLTRLGVKRRGGEILNPKFPFKFDIKEGVRVISSALHDGGISNNGRPTYKNNMKIMRKQVIDSYVKVFGDLKYGEYGPSISFPKITGIILQVVGLPKGKKVMNNPKIPNFIFKLNDNLKSIFLKQAFDDEGCVRVNDISLNLSVKANGKPSNLISGLKRLLQDVGIEVNGPYMILRYIPKDNITREKWALSIASRKDLESFHHQIGFDIQYKKIKLENKLKSYKTNKYQAKKNKRYLEILKSFKDLFKKNGFVTINSLSEKSGLTYHYTKQLIWRLERENFVVRINPDNCPVKFKLFEDHKKNN